MGSGIKIIELPAEDWQRFAGANSCQNAAEHKGSGPVRVKTAEYQGFPWTAFAGRYGPLGHRLKPYVEAWRLVPERLFPGATTPIYHGEVAIRRGERERGDHTGLVVIASGERMVCAERVHFEMGLPTTRPISLTEAAQFDEKNRAWGWRSLSFKDSEIDWFLLAGHPVARRSCDDRCHAVLFWRDGRSIEELSLIFEDFEFQPAISGAVEVEDGAPRQFELF
ncbi:hypothetical protein EVC37_21805 [Methylocaldum sp. BRCS4]|nr:hypothetical protein [Methylocaldum sp. BRCS4]